MKICLSLFFLFTSCFIIAQKTERLPLRNYRVNYLSDTLKETSGLSFFDKKLYTLNDGGNPAKVYHIDSKSGKIVHSIATNLINTDWEAITTDSSYIYLGDFGNNSNTRKDLTIYKTKIKNDSNLSLVSKIHFEYKEQTDFTPKNIRHNFDAEAMFHRDNKIHLFTKEWKNNATSHYIIDPNSSEKQLITKIESFSTQFLVTDASYYNQKLYLIGYTKKGSCYLLIFNCSNNHILFSHDYKKYKLGSTFSLGQIEGITVNQDGIYITGERFFKLFSKAQPTFYFIPFNTIKSISSF